MGNYLKKPVERENIDKGCIGGVNYVSNQIQVRKMTKSFNN